MGRRTTVAKDAKITVISPTPPTDKALQDFWAKLQEICASSQIDSNKKQGGN